MSEIKTKISTYNDVVDLFGEEKVADSIPVMLLSSPREHTNRISVSTIPSTARVI